MRVCKRGCGVKLFCFSRANHASTNLEKFSGSKLHKFTLFTYSSVGWNLENRYKEGVSVFFRLSWHFKREKSVFWIASFLQNKNWLRVQDVVYKTLRLVRISLLISTITKSLRFFSGKLFYKSNRKLFSCVCIAWYKHSRRWENSRQLCKPSTSSRVCITVSNSPNPSRVYNRLWKHGKRFLLLKCNYTCDDHIFIWGIVAFAAQMRGGWAVLVFFTGASACVRLKKFSEAISWCDKGLAASFS